MLYTLRIPTEMFVLVRLRHLNHGVIYGANVDIVQG